ncbi:MAG: glycosyltransferase, partial [Ignavibacteriaceae bacterium]
MKLKICHFVNHITGKSDGVYTHLVMLFKYLDNNKYEQFIVFQGNRKIENEMESLGIKYYVIPSLTKKVPIKSFFQFYKFVKSNHIDIIQTHFLKPYTIGGLTNIFLRKKMIHNYQGLFINNLYNSKLEKIVYRISHMIIYLFSAVDFAIVPSFKSRELLYKETKLFPQIKVYYNGYAPKLNKEFRVEVIN